MFFLAPALTIALTTGRAVGAPQAATATAPPAASAPASSDEASTLAAAYDDFLQGRTLEDKGDLPGAIAAYTRAIALEPKAAEIHAELAGLYARAGQATNSTTEAAAALAIDPDNHEAHRIYGLVDAALADNTSGDQAAVLAREAVRHLEAANATGEARDLTVDLALGRLYVLTKQYQKAIDVTKDFLLEQPDYPDAEMVLAQAYDANHQPALAADALTSLLSSDGTLTAARSRLAELDQDLGRWTDAAAQWEALARLVPRNAGQYELQRATALVGGGDLDGARTVLHDQVVASPRDISAWYLLAQVERRARNAAAAEDAAAHVKAIDPTDPRAALAEAEARTAASDYAGAVSALDPLYTSLLAAAAPAASLGVVAAQLSDALHEAGNDARAIDVLTAAQRKVPDDADLGYDLAGAYERSGRIDDAERTLRGMLATDPTQAATLNYLGYLLADHGRKLDEAVSLVKQALAIDAGNPSYLDSLGWAYFKQGKYPEAVAPLEQAAAALEHNSAVQAHLGELYFQLKRYRDAATAWTRALDGDRQGIDVAAVTKERDRARELGK